jgi:hypothetical protein
MIYTEGFSFKTRVEMEFLLPKLTDVLSTDNPMQLPQGMTLDLRTSSILLKIDSALAESLPACMSTIQSIYSATMHTTRYYHPRNQPFVKHMSKNCVTTFPWLTS